MHRLRLLLLHNGLSQLLRYDGGSRLYLDNVGTTGTRPRTARRRRRPTTTTALQCLLMLLSQL